MSRSTRVAASDRPARIAERIRLALAAALVLWSVPRPALAHSGPCSGRDTLTTVGLGSVLGILLFRPWRRSSTMSTAGRLGRWVLPTLLVSAATVGACSPKSTTATRPTTSAHLSITSPTPDQIVPPDFTLVLGLTGAKVVPATTTGGVLRGDEGHIHVSLDGKLITMTYGTTQSLMNIAPGPHTLQAEFVASDHAPFANRVIVAVAFSVSATATTTPTPASS